MSSALALSLDIFQIGGTVTDDMEVLIERRAGRPAREVSTLPHQCNDRRLSIDHGLNVGILVGRLPTRQVLPKAVMRAWFSSRSLEVGDVLGVGAGPPAFDVVDAQLVQQLGDLILSSTDREMPSACVPSRSVVS